MPPMLVVLIFQLCPWEVFGIIPVSLHSITVVDDHYRRYKLGKTIMKEFGIESLEDITPSNVEGYLLPILLCR